MASTKKAVRQPAHPTQPKSANLPIAYFEKLFSCFGVTPESLSGIPDFAKPDSKSRQQTFGTIPGKRAAWIKAVWAIQYVAERLNPGSGERAILSIPKAELRWFEQEIKKYPPIQYVVSDPDTGKANLHLLPGVNEEAEHTLAEIEDHLGFKSQALSAYMYQVATIWSQQPSVDYSSKPANIPTDTSGLMIGEQKKSFVHEGVRYFPLSAAAPVIQAPASSLLDWIKKKTKFNGEPLQSYHFAPANRYFISEESIERAKNRFIKWPSQEPAGPVTIGETANMSGYVGLTEAAKSIGVDHHTMWRWATKGTAPTDTPLQVVKCPASDQYYVSEKDVSQLKNRVPRSGLRRGRRPQLAL